MASILESHSSDSEVSDAAPCRRIQRFETKGRVTKEWLNNLVDGLTEQFAVMNKSINEVKEEIKTLNKGIVKRMDKIEDKVDKNTASIALFRSELDDLKQKYDDMKQENENLKQENEIIKKQTNKIETYSRRDNLLFSGIKENNNETAAECQKALRDFFVDILKLTDEESNMIKFIRCHRLHSRSINRQIIARFQEYKDRENIWNRLSNIPRASKYFISEDFPSQIKYNRRKLFPIFVKARRSGQFQKNKVLLKGDELTINDVQYTTKTLHTLKDDLHPNTFSEKSDQKVKIFGGIFSDYSVLSNYGKFPFRYGDIEFPTIEHGLVYFKCKEAGDNKLANKICSYSEPHVVKKLGRKLSIDFKKWESKQDKIMEKLLRAKFSRGSAAARELIATGTLTLAEAGLDKKYGTGIPITKLNALDHKAWIGENKLGKMLMKIREEIKTD